jgi:hypothetical protein
VVKFIYLFSFVFFRSAHHFTEVDCSSRILTICRIDLCMYFHKGTYFDPSKRILTPLSQIFCSLYLIRLKLTHYKTVRDLIRGSMNFFNWPRIMLKTCEIFVFHTRTFSACYLTISCKLVKSSGGPNFGKLIYLIPWFIFSQIFTHSSKLSCIFRQGSCTMYT